MTRKVGDKVKVNGSIQEIESITQWDKDIQRYEFIGGSGWHKIKGSWKNEWTHQVCSKRRRRVCEKKRQ